jgi:ubiquinone/menaquinone biosynthesis C-methylase UbiE
VDTNTDQISVQLHGMWAAVAPSWAEHADYVDARATVMTAAMLEATDPRPGVRVLELACGPGGLGLAAAPLVAPAGHVLLSDVVPEMTAIAGARARALGIENVSTAELDLEEIEQPDDTFDLVLCREGLMFARDAERAVREIRRVLRPAGRIAITVWGPRAGNPWLSVVFDAVSAELGMPVPPPGVPGPFSLDDLDTFAGLFRTAGFAGVAVRELPVPLRTASFEEWWSRTSSLAGPLSKLLASLPAATTDGVKARLREAVRVYETPTGYQFPGVALLAVGGH